MNFDPYVIGELNEQTRREVHSLRIEERRRKNRKPRGSRLTALVKRGRLLTG